MSTGYALYYLVLWEKASDSEISAYTSLGKNGLHSTMNAVLISSCVGSFDTFLCIKML